MDRGATGEVLPASQDEIDIGRADLDTDAGAAGHFGRDQARARAEKRVIDQLAGPTVVEDRTAHALDRLLRAVPPALLALSIYRTDCCWRSPTPWSACGHPASGQPCPGAPRTSSFHDANGSGRGSV